MRLHEAASNKMISDFINLCKVELELPALPTIEFINESSIDGLSFGEYTSGLGNIKVIIKNRHPMDIARTLAHELVHWKQDLENLDLGSVDIENQANSVAAMIMRKLASAHPEYFDADDLTVNEGKVKDLLYRRNHPWFFPDEPQIKTITPIPKPDAYKVYINTKYWKSFPSESSAKRAVDTIKLRSPYVKVSIIPI